jgi:hypothetical protein
MAGKHHLYVIGTAGNFLVRPGTWATDPKTDKSVKIRNMTPYKVRVNLPAAVVNDPKGPTVNLDPVRTATDRDERLLDGNCQAGFHTYTVAVMVETEVAAQGESEPVIIIDP